MEFTCAHCGNAIFGLTMIVDKQHLVHQTCEKEFIETQKDIEKLFEIENQENLTEA